MRWQPQCAPGIAPGAFFRAQSVRTSNPARASSPNRATGAALAAGLLEVIGDGVLGGVP